MTSTPSPAPSPEDFLSQPSDPDEEADEFDPTAPFDQAPADLQPYVDEVDRFTRELAGQYAQPNPHHDPLQSIAESLRTIAASYADVSFEADHTEADRYEQQIADLEVEYRHMATQIEQVLALCKPSTSKLANNIRKVLNPPAPEPKAESVAEEKDRLLREAASESPDLPETEPDSETPQPADDATVEEWRQFAQDMAGDAHDWDKFNRSQIRTALGIAQPTPPSED
jgi:hypothetical protein